MNFNEFLFAQLYLRRLESLTYKVIDHRRVYNDIKEYYAKYINSGYYPTDGNEEDCIMVIDSIEDYLKFEVRIINY